MAGIRTKIDDRQLLRRLDRLEDGLADATPLMRIWGEIVQTSASQNFEAGGRPKRWQPLAAVTVKQKGHARPLIGRTRNLSSLVVRPQSRRVIIGTQPAARAYAAIHQFGGRAGRGHKVRIPRRPFLLLQNADRTEMQMEARQYLKRIARA